MNSTQALLEAFAPGLRDRAFDHLIAAAAPSERDRLIRARESGASLASVVRDSPHLSGAAMSTRRHEILREVGSHPMLATIQRSLATGQPVPGVPSTPADLQSWVEDAHRRNREEAAAQDLGVLEDEDDGWDTYDHSQFDL